MVDHRQKMWWQRLEVAAVAICAKTQAPPQRNATLEAKTEGQRRTRHAANGTS